MTRAFHILAAAAALLLIAGQALAIDRIGVRVTNGEGEFYNTVTGETFRPRGANYVDFQPTGAGFSQDRALATDVFNPGRISDAFELMKSYGYDTVRLFFDLCNEGSQCITSASRQGLNPEYMDNMAQFTRIAASHGIYVLFTSNDIPDHGGYGALANRDAGPRVEGYRNAHYMTAGGIEAFELYWTDLMAALSARDTAWEAVLGWSLVNEQWIFKNDPPWSLNSGTFTNGTGQTYDLSDPAQKRAALSDNLIEIIARTSAVIKAADPEALVTMGFFAPQHPNETFIGGNWFVDTEPLLAGSVLDFYDFHAYTDTDLTVQQQAENFGMPQHRDKAVIMGEVGASPAFLPGVSNALRAEQQWMAESCDEGFDGWLHWGWYPFPPGVDEHPPYTMLSHERIFLVGLSPRERPDPCFKGGYEPHSNLALEATVRASRYLPGHPPENAIDGRDSTWESGTDAPGWVEITLPEPGRMDQVTVWLAQYPAGETRTLVTAKTAGGQTVLVADHTAETRESDKLVFPLPGGLDGVASVRVEVVNSPSWISFYDIELRRSSAEGASCLLTARSAVNLRGDTSTEEPPVGGLGGGQSMLGVERVAVPESPDWFRTHSGSYVRSDVITVSEACAELIAR